MMLCMRTTISLDDRIFEAVKRVIAGPGHQPLPDLGRWADARCRVLHGDAVRTYVIDRNGHVREILLGQRTYEQFEAAVMRYL